VCRRCGALDPAKMATRLMNAVWLESSMLRGTRGGLHDITSRPMRRALILAVALVLFGASPAYADGAYVDTPIPQPFTVGADCNLQCSSPALLLTTTPTFVVFVSGAEGHSLYTTFEVRTAPSTKAPIVGSWRGDPAVPFTLQRFTVPQGVLAAETPYYWRARSENERGRLGGWSAWETFTIDDTRPDAPTVHSYDYPQDQWGGGFNVPGTFHFSASESDVVEFSYLMDNESGRVPATGTGPMEASLVYAPVRPGYITLHVAAIDRAGNRGVSATYNFWVGSSTLGYLYWALDGNTEDNGTIGEPGTVSGDVTFGPGVYRDAAVFNGGTISTAANVLDTTQSFSLTAWARPAGLAIGSQTIIDNGAARLYYDAPTNRWCAALQNAVACTAGAVPPTDGRWVRLMMRYYADVQRLSIFAMGDPFSCYFPSERADVSAAGVASDAPLVVGGGWRGSIDEVQAHRAVLQDPPTCQNAMVP
jgi:hypothetical protein